MDEKPVSPLPRLYILSETKSTLEIFSFGHMSGRNCMNGEMQTPDHSTPTTASWDCLGNLVFSFPLFKVIHAVGNVMVTYCLAYFMIISILVKDMTGISLLWINLTSRNENSYFENSNSKNDISIITDFVPENCLDLSFDHAIAYLFVLNSILDFL
jgi:hypothetical protein